MPLAREEKQEIITGYATKEGDTGSPEVQIALLTERIKELTEHLRQLPQGQPFAPRPPQARRPAPPPSCVSDQEGQRALPRRHRTARTPPLAIAAPGPRVDPGVHPRPDARQRRAGRPAAGRLLLHDQGGIHPRVSDIRDAARWSHADHRDRQARRASPAAPSPSATATPWCSAPPTVRSRDPASTSSRSPSTSRSGCTPRARSRAASSSARRAPSEDAILAARQTDRPIRPLFPEGYKDDIQLVITVLSTDQENEPDVLGTIAASAALTISEIPFNGPVGAVRVGRIDGEFVVNPTYSRARRSPSST